MGWRPSPTLLGSVNTADDSYSTWNKELVYPLVPLKSSCRLQDRHAKYGLRSDERVVFRRNMQAFGISVSIVEPGFFKTNVTRLDLIEADLRRLWSCLPQGVRDSYGPAYFDDCECESRLLDY